MTRRTALVTGGAGFIGSELVAQLVGDGFSVRIVDNLVNGREENVRGQLGSRCELIVADVRDPARIEPALREVDVLYHLACLGVRHSIHSPRENHAVNAEGTLALLLLARDSSRARFVHVSTSEVYGTARFVPLNEDHPTLPETVYGASKLAGEAYARAFYRTYRYPTVVVRPFNAYGPRCHHEGDSGEVIPRFILRAMAGLPLVIFGDGAQTRDFTFVSDTARGILAAGLAEDVVGETFNVGSGQEITIEALAREVVRVVGGPASEIAHEAPRPGDVRRLLADASRARQRLAFGVNVALAAGLAQLRDWYLACDRSPRELIATEQVRNWERS